jgi:transcriptional regulator with XRE-family HTH domain
MTFATIKESLPFEAIRPVICIRALRAHGYTVSSFAKAIGVPQPNVSEVMHGRSRIARVETRLAELVGVPHHELFPRKEKAA